MLDKFFNPKCVAVIGDIHTRGDVANIILENFTHGGFAGKVFPVNPEKKSIFDLQVHDSVKKIPEKVDLAVIAVRSTLVPKVLNECSEKKIPAAVIMSSGFSEIGKTGANLEDELRKVVKKKRTRVIGPNVVGVYDSVSKVNTISFLGGRTLRTRVGQIAFVTQSAAVGSTAMEWFSSEDIGMSKFISYGNAVDVNECDILEYLAEDEKTKVVSMYLEGVRSSGKKFIRALKKASREKPVVILKAGKTEKSSRTVLSHAGTLSGSAKIYSAVFKQFGAVEAKDWKELFDFVKVFSMQPLPAGEKTLIVTNGGGFGILAADEAEKQGLKLEDPIGNIANELKKNLPLHAAVHNPLDLTADADDEKYGRVLEEAVKNYDAVVVIALFQTAAITKRLTNVLIAAQKHGKPIVCCLVGGDFTKRIAKRLEKFSVPAYPTPERAVKSVSALVRRAKFLQKR